jgi:hypothetical protein
VADPTLNSNGQPARCNYFGNIAQLGAGQGESVVKMYNGPSTRRARELFSRHQVEEGDFPWPCSNCGVFQRRHGGPVQDIAAVASTENRKVSLTLLSPAEALL